MKLNRLTSLDLARCHISALLISGMGFFTDAYNLFCIPPISQLLGRIYYDDVLPIHVKAFVNGIALCGAFVGHLFFGWLGDKIGRKKLYGINLVIMISTSIGSGFSIGRSRESVITSLCFFRFWLGFGIGGDFPVSATIMAEFSSAETRGAFMAAVFAMQGAGILCGSLVAMIVSACFQAAFHDLTFGQKDIVWRIILMLGAIPAGLTYYWRMKVPETAASVAKTAEKSTADMSEVMGVPIEEDNTKVSRKEKRKPSYGLLSKDFLKNHGRHLLGTMSCWFFVDIPLYSSNLYQKDVYKAIGWLKKSEEYNNPLDEVFNIAKEQALVAICGTLPGCVLTVFLIDRIGRLPLQLLGFLFISVLCLAMALSYDNFFYKGADRYGFLTIYTLTFFVTMFGPNTTSFIVPAELFPARFRSTCNGISGAAGKAGAIVGVFGLVYAAQPKNKNSPYLEKGYPTGEGGRMVFIVLAVASFMGFLCTFLIPETNGMSLEETEGESVTESCTTTGYTELSVDTNNKAKESSPVSVNNYSSQV
ncbi:hypothetical protein SUGI_0428580 [Cryptomeria japonica]|uniref:probable inorganic phosphate transporter 1-3 n=1 Tax=Cryptomeria japonica TaxID=3369 RepID=UPI002408DE3A|nr:probable inorganic phosphate transporter 1-3 [Cryptomeria japonica]GLJ22754.1 hypothetical protein SUGI_0428580 [Cryptomeria japonica]